MTAGLKDDSMKVQLEMTAAEYAELRAFADAHRPEPVAEEIHYLPDYGALLSSAALQECQAAGYRDFDELEAAAAANPVSPEATQRMWNSIVTKLRLAGLWVEDTHSEVKGRA